MPTYQMSPSYDSNQVLSQIVKAYHLWLPDYVYAAALLAARGGAGVGLGIGAAVAAASREAQSRGGRRATEERATGNGVVRKVLHDCLYFSSCGRKAFCPASRP